MCDCSWYHSYGTSFEVLWKYFQQCLWYNRNTELNAVWRIDRRQKDEKKSQQVLYAQAIYMAGHIRCNATPKSNFMDR